MLSAQNFEPANRGAPWLTVIMPVYRGERWIDAALTSLAEQADDGIELLVIDSSPDSSSADIARRFADRIAMRVFENSPLGSWQSKTNYGVTIARADHICWLHQDDLWLPGRASAIRQWIDAAPDAALHLAASAIVDRCGRQIGVWRCPFKEEGEIHPKRFVERLLVQNFISAPAPVYRKDAWLACGGLDEELWYTGDWDVWLKLAASGPVHHHRKVTTAFRVHGNSLTVTGSRNIEDFERQMRVVLDRHLPRLPAGDKSIAIKVERASTASIKVNCALAAASGGAWRALVPAARSLLALGPLGLRRYMRDSRIVERLMPRLRAKLTGSF
ncbi:MAG: glycosyl transferase [Alphaproteobacteria bacterium]|nr:glycosyl transferase [Alphaproteobacteria bacterium]